MRVAIIGAGAAGCFCAVVLKRLRPETDVTIFERARRTMVKLALTGGGRCNLTNTFAHVADLAMAYPRGARLMQRLFRQFGPEETLRWWEQQGVRLVVQDDDCVFPASQDAREIVGTLLTAMRQTDVHLRTNAKVTSVEAEPQESENNSARCTANCEPSTKEPTAGCLVRTDATCERFDRVLVATGGSPRPSGLAFLPDTEVVAPVPSLFAMNAGDESLHALMGTVVERCQIAVAGTKFRAEGTLLLTHFGFSGPAMLRLSSYAARHLAEQDYRVTLLVNWMQGAGEEEVRRTLSDFRQSAKLTANHHPLHLTSRHWLYLLGRAHVAPTQRWDALNAKEANRLLSVLTTDAYPTTGRCAYKGEFVTCGGVSLQEVDSATLALKRHLHIHLAGEALDIDGITGGFNLQAAWTTGYVVAHAIARDA